jgi:hypothetical protein
MLIKFENLLLFILTSKHRHPWGVLYSFGLCFLLYGTLRGQPFKKSAQKIASFYAQRFFGTFSAK